MKIEEFVNLSEGQWRSMRSGHSLAFRQFEQIISNVHISFLKEDDPNLIALLNANKDLGKSYKSPFQVQWMVEEDWDSDNDSGIKSGSSILIPFPKSNCSGYILRSLGYTEPIQSLSRYHFLNDETFILQTDYEKTVTEERIWFLSQNMRCRSSVIYTEGKKGILQTSFASELRLKDNHNNYYYKSFSG